MTLKSHAHLSFSHESYSELLAVNVSASFSKVLFSRDGYKVLITLECGFKVSITSSKLGH